MPSAASFFTLLAWILVRVSVPSLRFSAFFVLVASLLACWNEAFLTRAVCNLSNFGSLLQFLCYFFGFVNTIAKAFLNDSEIPVSPGYLAAMPK